ncbi:protein of unknown function [Methylocaldum szegediense]|uniref:Transposase n=1 Tax=Methylocaldum szegediense TaxID=73780 RepID=A0ABN8X392_9GAMM|nr:protein of unknown function [Methylocaldum szegediense]
MPSYGYGERTTKTDNGPAKKSLARQFSIRFGIPMAFASADIEARCHQHVTGVQFPLRDD